MKGSRCFVDANVWLYWLTSDKRIPAEERFRKRQLASNVLQQLDLVVSTQVVNEVCVNLVKKAGFNEVQIRKVIEEFELGCDVAVLTSDTLMQASQLRSQYGFSFWDGLIVASALISGASILYSEDMHSGLVVSKQLQIVNPFQ
ncbi:MAG: PIN domain-containing protein [Calothrix sp. FI2-JRJ7]|jgi:predicted nucleic acid-binding protein|nr:PIN domain-containing protein [Calothrix sp. FI2-JRJ7]